MNSKLAILALMPFAIVYLAIFLTKMFLNTSLQIGLYDPTGIYDYNENIVFNHAFVAWTSKTAVDEIQEHINRTSSLKRQAIITLEPWFDASIDPNGNNFPEDVVNGKYDHYIESVCNEIGSVDVEVYIRFGHEMDLKTSRYPWSWVTPGEFTNIYRYFVDKCRIYAPETKFVWSPVGNESLELYWPGENYVDLIGVSVFSFDEWEVKNYGKTFSFDEIFSPKYNRIKQYKKEVVIPELGVTGSKERKTIWLKQAAESFSKYPYLSSVIYFNSQDILAVWGTEVPTPDWRITDKDLKTLLNN